MDVRSFERRDREQLRDLASAHVGAAIPGATLPAATLLDQLERPSGEYVVGPWVTDLATLVVTERDRIVAAAHLRRYARDGQVGEDYRNAGEIVWLLCWPDHLKAGRAVRDAGLVQLSRWGVSRWFGDGSLPAPGVYGVSDSWPHIQELYREAGFDASGGQVEIVYSGALASFPDVGDLPLTGLAVRRRLGPIGTAFDAVLDSEVVGSFEVDVDLTRGGANLAFAGWADECNHWVREDLRGCGIGSWLMAHGGAWLRLGRVERFLSYAIEDDQIDRCTAFYGRSGLHPCNRTVRGWQREPDLKTDPG